MKKFILILFVLILLTLPFVAAETCQVSKIKQNLRKALYEYFNSPQGARLALGNIQDLLNFYLGIQPGQTQVNCDGVGQISGEIFARIIQDANNITVTIPTCSDGTEFGECSISKPKYCYNGNVVNKCSVCGCATGSCSADGSCSVSQPVQNQTQPNLFCGDSACNNAETCSTCSADCGSCPVSNQTQIVCGNGICQTGESCTSCQIDCGSCSTTPSTTPFYTKEVTLVVSSASSQACIQPGFGVADGVEPKLYGQFDRSTGIYTDFGNRPTAEEPLAIRVYCATSTPQILTLTTDKGNFNAYLPDTDALAETLCIASDGSSYSAHAISGKGSNDYIPDMTCTQAMNSQQLKRAAPLVYCGDNICNGVETCSSCAADCGSCQVQNQTACSNECTYAYGQLSCSGGYVRVCGYFDTDSCSEWNTVALCQTLFPTMKLPLHQSTEKRRVIFDDNKIVWVDRTGPSFEDIYYYDFLRKTEKLILDENYSAHVSAIDIYQNKLVGDIQFETSMTKGFKYNYLYDLSTQTIKDLVWSSDIRFQTSSIYDDKVLFTRYNTNFNRYEYFIYNIMDFKETLIPDLTKHTSLNLYGGGIISLFNKSIYHYDLSNNKKSLLISGVDSIKDIDEDKIVYLKSTNAAGFTKIYVYDISENKEYVIIPTIINTTIVSTSPNIDNNKVVWSADSDIFLFDLITEKEIRITNTSNYYESDPLIYGNKIVWIEFFPPAFFGAPETSGDIYETTIN